MALLTSQWRHLSRFMFKPSKSFGVVLELDQMVSKTVIPDKKSFSGARPFAYTEHGVVML